MTNLGGSSEDEGSDTLRVQVDKIPQRQRLYPFVLVTYIDVAASSETKCTNLCEQSG